MVKKQSSIAWDIKTMIHWSIAMFFLGGLASFYRYYSQQELNRNIKFTLSTTTTTITTTISNTNTNTNTTTNTTKGAQQEEEDEVFVNQRWLKVSPPSLTETCDLFSGRWVYDNNSRYPLYEETECPRLSTDLACQTYGRKDSKYLHWRWQPHGCDLPRFDGKEVGERLKGKRLLFVGDSVNRNQWVSLTCMLYTSLPGKKKFGIGLNRTLFTFRIMDYNLSVDYHWAPMFVESNGDNPSDHRLEHRTVRINSIESHARHWVDADILIFNNYLWWRLPIIKLLKSPGSLLGGPNQVYDEINNVRAYKMVLKTWSKWIHSNIDTDKTEMFFMGPTATHSRATEWGGKRLKSCYKEEEPVMVDGFWSIGTNTKMLRLLEKSLSDLKAKGVNVQLINITQLTQYRKDAHPTIYKKIWRPLTDEQKNHPEWFSDCTHWCLPGVPDIWNELLLAYISPVAG